MRDIFKLYAEICSQCVCCVRYITVHGANLWTNWGALGSPCQINTWAATQSGDRKHSSSGNNPMCIQLLFFQSRVCSCASAVLQYVRRRMHAPLITAAQCHSWASRAFSRVTFWRLPHCDEFLWTKWSLCDFKRSLLNSLSSLTDCGWCKNVFWLQN